MTTAAPAYNKQNVIKRWCGHYHSYLHESWYHLYTVYTV